MVNAKTRRHSGRITPGIIFDGMSKKEIIESCLEPIEKWDDWQDYRDGFRFNKDRKMIRKTKGKRDIFNVKGWNKKLEKLIKRRKLRKLNNKQ